MNIMRWLTAIFIVVLIIASLGFAKFSQIQQAIAFAESFPEPSATVKATNAGSTEYRSSVKITGQIKATESLTVRNEYGGRLTQVNFQPGDLVSKSQVLMVQDSSEEKARLLAAKARLKLATSSLKRISSLAEQDKVSEEELDQAFANKAVAEADVLNLKSIITKKTIKAPFSGRVGLSQHQVGQLLAPSSNITELVGVSSDIWVDFMLPQTLPQLAKGDTVEINLIKNGQSQPTPVYAQVIARHAAINSNSRQLRYRAILNNQDDNFYHNQIVSVVAAQPAEQVIVVPSAAVTRSQVGNFVFQLHKDDAQNFRALPVKVTLGARLGDLQIVKEGLTEGDFIATEGAFKLSEGLLVYVANPSQADTSGATP